MRNDTLILHIISEVSSFRDTFLNREVYFPVLLPAMLLPNGSLFKDHSFENYIDPFDSFFKKNAITKKISAGKSS